jgi:ammonium transporter, Amt family
VRVAERMKFGAYVAVAVVMTGLIYPIVGAWTWGGGWVDELGFADFAGSTIVHMTGGVAALVGAAFLGPRIGKFDPKTGKARAIPGHSIAARGARDPAAVLRLVRLQRRVGPRARRSRSSARDRHHRARRWCRWHGGRALHPPQERQVGRRHDRQRHPGRSGRHHRRRRRRVATWRCSSADRRCLVALSVRDRPLKIDDPVGAISVHGTCGILGTLWVGLAATDGGLFFGGGAELLIAQVIGIVGVAAWVGGHLGHPVRRAEGHGFSCASPSRRRSRGSTSTSTASPATRSSLGSGVGAGSSRPQPGGRGDRPGRGAAQVAAAAAPSAPAATRARGPAGVGPDASGLPPGP